MMPKYLGETWVDISQTPYKDYTKEDWILYYIGRYGQIDGDHHKLWVMDQIARIIHGSDIHIKLASWSDGQTEYRIKLDKQPTERYLSWISSLKDREQGPETYDYDIGCPP